MLQLYSERDPGAGVSPCFYEIIHFDICTEQFWETASGRIDVS